MRPPGGVVLIPLAAGRTVVCHGSKLIHIVAGMPMHDVLSEMVTSFGPVGAEVATEVRYRTAIALVSQHVLASFVPAIAEGALVHVANLFIVRVLDVDREVPFAICPVTALGASVKAIATTYRANMTPGTLEFRIVTFAVIALEKEGSATARALGHFSAHAYGLFEHAVAVGAKEAYVVDQN